MKQKKTLKSLGYFASCSYHYSLDRVKKDMISLIIKEIISLIIKWEETNEEGETKPRLRHFRKGTSSLSFTVIITINKSLHSD